MIIPKFYIRFNLKSGDVNTKGLAPVRCRITFNKSRKDFSTGLRINPDYWDSHWHRVKENSEQEQTVNMQISLIENKISKAFLMLQVGEEPFSVNDIFNTLKKDMGIIEVYDLHNERIMKLIGKEIVLVTYQKYLESERHLKDRKRSWINQSELFSE